MTGATTEARIDAKQFATLRVRAALLGASLTLGTDDNGRATFPGVESGMGLTATPESADSADAYRAAVAAVDERFVRARRGLAACGFDLIVTSDAGRALFIVGKWGMSREFGDLDRVEVFARQVGATC